MGGRVANRRRYTVELRLRLAPLPTVWCSDPAGLSVGLQSGRDDILRGRKSDDGIEFEIQIAAKPAPDGIPDFFGPLVHGTRGNRFLYVSWGTSEHTDHDMFRRLKLYLGPLSRKSFSQSGISWKMIEKGSPIRLEVSGCGPDGTPHCGTARVWGHSLPL